MLGTGSSPHTRGTPEAAGAGDSDERFIPAYAGNAAATPSPTAIRAVHPRIRGERGILPNIVEPTPWFIPAYAGNASGMQSIQCRPAVHPRIRGERSMKAEVPQNTLGSSPHTRGTRLMRIVLWASSRFIPAYAGNASAISRLARSDSVHPRIRGERLAQSGDPDYKFGSSPHTRGTHARSHRYALPLRFIPAYAGNAWVRYIWTRTRPVHPRIRGERMSRAMQDASGSGSSPHTRGTPTSSNLVQHYSRFIPAYAGNARPAYNVPGSIAVHPRIRGERMPLGRLMVGGFGSSPHTRGTPPVQPKYFAPTRFIPAYAGNAR